MDLSDHDGPVELADGLLACAIADANGVVRGFNAAFPQQLGFSSAQLNRRPLIQLFEEDVRPEVEQVLADVRRGVQCHVAWPTRMGTGKLQYCEWHLQPRALRGSGASGSEIAVVPIENQRSEWRRLNDAHDRFRSIASGMAAMVWVAGADGAIRASNRAWREFLGGVYPSPDVWRVVLHPVDYADAMRLRARAPVTGEAAVGTYRLRRYDGVYRWVEERIVRQVGDDGETLFVASCNDVTSEHEMRERLGQALALTEGILSSALDAIITIDGQNRIVAFNPAAERQFGYAASEIIGEKVTRLMPERFRQGHASRIQAYVERKGPARRLGGAGSGVCGVRADGTEFPMEATVSLVQTPRGPLITAIIRDITAQLAAMREIQDREQRLRIAIESANLGGAEIDIATGRLIATDAAARLLGLGDDPARWIVPNFTDIVHPDDRGYVLGVVDAIVREDRALDAEFRALRPDGAERWMYGRGKLYRGPHGEPQRVIGVLMDIEPRKQSEAQLRSLSKRVLEVQEDERRRIARELHDQIGQALTAALINLQMLAPDVAPGPAHEMRSTLTSVLSQVRELSLNLRPTMLDSLGLEPALRWYLDRQAALGRFKVELACPTSPRLPVAIETLLFRLVQEAITNILRHARAKHVGVQVERTNEEVVLTVRDDGVGFDPEAVLARANAGNSFGVLGMAERAQLAGGLLRFESRPGAGASVIAVLPLKRD